MSNGSDHSDLEGATRINQVIVGALSLGVVGFMGLVLVFGLGKPEGPPQGGQPAIFGLGPITLAAAFMGVFCLIGSFLAPRLVTLGGLRQLAGRQVATRPRDSRVGDRESAAPSAAEQLLPLFQTQLIVGAAVAEGGAFFSLVAYMIETNHLMLVLAFVLLTVLFFKFPTVDRVAGWIDEKRVALNELRQAGS